MSSDPLTIITAANAKLSSFLLRTTKDAPLDANQGEALSVIQRELTAVASIVEEAGHAVRTIKLSQSINQEETAQIDFYARNLQELKILLLPLLASAQEKRRRMAENTEKIHEAQSWLNTLGLTKTE